MFRLNVFLSFLLAPFLALFLVGLDFSDASNNLAIQVSEAEEEIKELKVETNNLGQVISDFIKVTQEQERLFNEQNEKLNELSTTSASQRKLSDDIYEQRILNMLGPAIHTHLSNRTEIKIFKLDELGYRGYIAKVKLFTPQAFKVVLAQDKLGKLETTSRAAKRKNAILAINGGGFYMEKRNDSSYARLIGNTVIDGKLVEPFNGYPGNLFFAGINRNGQVIGTVPKKESDITSLNPYQGVSFIPVLLKNSQKCTIPADWKTTKQPRTIIGKYANDDLIMIVVDGRQDDWSVGVTLERLQDKLLELGVKEAYNLDGGGSSVMYFKGQILNRPSDGKERAVANNIVVLP